MLKIPVFILEQPGGTFYYGALSRNDIVNKLVVRRRTAHPDGVQRDLARDRISDITEYISTADAILPTPLVISVENATLEGMVGAYNLLIEPGENGIWGEIIDGQHRYEGLKFADNFGAYQIPVCIFVKLSVEDKATVFSTINSTQVRVPKSYIYDLFDYTDKNTPIKFCHEVCKALNYDSNGPLFRHIKMLGKKLNDEEVLSQGALVDSLLPLITQNRDEDDRIVRRDGELKPDKEMPLRQLYIDADIIVFSKIITNYLASLKIVSGQVWAGYVLRSIGIKVFMRVLGYISGEGVRKGDLSVNFFTSQLSILKDEIDKCSTSSGTNKGVENSQVQMLIQIYKDRTSSEA